MTRKRTRRRRSGTLLAVLLLWTWQTLGANAAEPSPAAGEAEEQASADHEDKASTRADGGDSPEIFVPTEEISEDFAVSFPVDI